jgi:ABC-type antimicrobial peptide transport system permease subunit
MIEAILMALGGIALGYLVGIALGYGFLGQIIGQIEAEVNNLSATAKLDAVKAKTEMVKAAVDAHTDVVTDLHTAISDLDKKL